MDIFNAIAGLCSIFSFVMGLFDLFRRKRRKSRKTEKAAGLTKPPSK